MVNTQGTPRAGTLNLASTRAGAPRQQTITFAPKAGQQIYQTSTGQLVTIPSGLLPSVGPGQLVNKYSIFASLIIVVVVTT